MNVMNSVPVRMDIAVGGIFRYVYLLLLDVLTVRLLVQSQLALCLTLNVMNSVPVLVDTVVGGDNVVNY